MASPKIGLLAQEHVGECERILRALPDWFGIPDEVERYIASLRTLTSFAVTLEGRVVGFIALSQMLPESVGIHVMAVDPSCHRRGVGRMLVERAESWTLAQGAHLLHVMTLSARARYAPYESTRAFYRAMGFTALLETTDPWGEENPTLVMVKTLKRAAAVQPARQPDGQKVE